MCILKGEKEINSCDRIGEHSENVRQINNSVLR